MNKKMVFILVLLMAAGAQAGYAKVSLEPDFTGTVMITSPDGKVLMLGPGDKIPEISSDSKIEVFPEQGPLPLGEGGATAPGEGRSRRAPSSGPSGHLLP